MSLQRAVKVEAGHRCAIPTCRQVPVELAHVEPWSKVKEHTFENLIALCPTCHSRFDRGEIDRQAMRQYKANLGVINGRYGEIERRYLEALRGQPVGYKFGVPVGTFVSIMYLAKDGLIKKVPPEPKDNPTFEWFELTERGRALIQQLAEAEDIEPD